MRSHFQCIAVFLVLNASAIEPENKKSKESFDWANWIITEGQKSPITDAQSFSARSFGDSEGLSSLVMGCEEGKMYFYIQPTKMRMSTQNEHFYPIIYRVDSQPAVDCTAENYPQICQKWSLRYDGAVVGIWEDPESFIDEIENARKLTIRVSNIRGQQKTVIFRLKDVLPTYAKVRGLCGAGEPVKNTVEEAAQ